MRRALALAAIAGLLASWACERRAETPPEVTRAHEELLRSLDENAPGASLGKLREFARRHEQYKVASTVEAEVKAWQAKLEPAYLRSRDLVRAERFDEAEAILRDLAALEDERAGGLAREFLAFEFLQLKASRLLMRGDSAGAQAVARGLRGRPLTPEQLAATERLLDAASTVDVAGDMTAAAAFQATARSLQVVLHSVYAEEGRYPEALTLDSPALAGLRGGGSFDRVAAIEHYAAGPDTFSLVLRGKDPRLQLRVTQGSIDAVGAGGTPGQPGAMAVAGAQPAVADPVPDAAGAVGAVDRRVRMTMVTPFQSAARSLQALLLSSYAEEGRYPEALTLDAPALAGLRGASFFAGVAAIESYAAGPDQFSLVLVGKDPRQRLRVTPSTIEEVGAATRP
jgi:hypothetical protein